jgi:hypothetical protein
MIMEYLNLYDIDVQIVDNDDYEGEHPEVVARFEKNIASGEPSFLKGIAEKYMVDNKSAMIGKRLRMEGSIPKVGEIA